MRYRDIYVYRKEKHMKVKRILSALLCLIMLFGAVALTGCNVGENTDGEPTDSVSDTEKETEPPVETTEAPVETTSAPEVTEAPVVTELEVTEPAPEKKGCGASAMPIAAVACAAAAAVALKKKKED
jgi:hypothetical protein